MLERRRKREGIGGENILNNKNNPKTCCAQHPAEISKNSLREVILISLLTSERVRQRRERTGITPGTGAPAWCRRQGHEPRTRSRAGRGVDRALATHRGHRQSAPVPNDARWVSAPAGLSCKPRVCQRTRWERRWCSAQAPAGRTSRSRRGNAEWSQSVGAAGEQAAV